MNQTDGARFMVIFFDILLVAACAAIAWFGFYVIYRLVTD